MRTTVLAMVAAMATTSAMAQDLGTTGLTLNTEAEAQYKLDADAMTVKLTPELGYTFNNIDLTAATTFELYDNTNGFTLDNELDHLPIINFGASYMANDDLELELGTAYNLETKTRDEITLTATFAF